MLSRRFALFALLAAMAALLAPAPASAQEAGNDSDQRTFTVSGEGFVFADNDIATFRLGVTTRRPTPGSALLANSARMTRVIAAIRAAGVAEEDVRTEVVSVRRSTIRRTPRAPRRIVFIATNAVAVTVRDIARAGALVDAGVRAGATGVSGPSFGLADPGAVYRDALALAFRAARAKAERLAAESGVRLGPVLRIQEGGVGEEFRDQDQSAERAPAQGAPSTPVQPGRERVDASVVVVFAIE